MSIYFSARQVLKSPYLKSSTSVLVKIMKIAIHNSPHSFSDKWISYCEKNKIDYKIVNAYDSDIINHLSDCDAFMWHHAHYDYRDCLFAKQLIFTLNFIGEKNSAVCIFRLAF